MSSSPTQSSVGKGLGNGGQDTALGPSGTRHLGPSGRRPGHLGPLHSREAFALGNGGPGERREGVDHLGSDRGHWGGGTWTPGSPQV